MIELNKVPITVIVPVYNVEKYLAECLDSIINQKINEDIEILCINDGSTDKSYEILNKYMLKFSNIRVINQSNRGLSETRNIGIKHANGKYIFFLDSDDYLNSQTLEILYKEAEEKNLQIVMGNMVFDYVDKVNNFILERSQYIQNKVITGLELLEYDYMHLYACNKLYLKDFIISNNLFFIENVTFEDFVFTPKVYAVAERVKYIDSSTYYYRQRENSITHQKIKNLEEIFILIDELEILYKNYKSKTILNLALKLYKDFIIQNMICENKSNKYYKMLKVRKIPWKFLKSNDKNFKIYGIKYLLGLRYYAKVRLFFNKCLKIAKNRW